MSGFAAAYSALVASLAEFFGLLAAQRGLQISRSFLLAFWTANGLSPWLVVITPGMTLSRRDLARCVFFFFPKFCMYMAKMRPVGMCEPRLLWIFSPKTFKCAFILVPPSGSLPFVFLNPFFLITPRGG